MKNLNPIATLNLIGGSIPMNIMMIVCCGSKLLYPIHSVYTEFPPTDENIYHNNIDIWFMMISHCIQLASLITQKYATKWDYKYVSGIATIIRIIAYLTAFIYLCDVFDNCEDVFVLM